MENPGKNSLETGDKTFRTCNWRRQTSFAISRQCTKSKH